MLAEVCAGFVADLEPADLVASGPFTTGGFSGAFAPLLPFFAGAAFAGEALEAAAFAAVDPLEALAAPAVFPEACFVAAAFAPVAFERAVLAPALFAAAALPPAPLPAMA